MASSAESFSRCSVHISALVTRRAVCIALSLSARCSHSSRRSNSCIRCAARAPISAATPAVVSDDCAERAAFSARAKRPSSRLLTASTSACWPPISSRRARYSRTCSGKSTTFWIARAAQYTTASRTTKATMNRFSETSMRYGWTRNATLPALICRISATTAASTASSNADISQRIAIGPGRFARRAPRTRCR